MLSLHSYICSSTAGFISSVSSVFLTLLGKKYEKYEIHTSMTFFLEKFFLFIYLFFRKLSINEKI